ncbi:MAG: hypothetical protein IJZ25_01660 [Lachnospiraceae bacterium]|nr:hypothetical protein [Lachnospiraceae bacterium]
MLLDILDISTAYATIGTFTALGVGVKLLLGSIYKRDIRNARSIEHTKKRWMKRMKRNFEKTFGDGLSRDAELFVENEMNGRQVCGVSLKSLDELVNQLPLVILTATTAFDFWFVRQGASATDLVSFTLFGATMCLAIHSFNMMVNNDSKESRLRIILTQYFGNEKLPLILMNQYADENLIERKADYSPNALVAVSKEEMEEEGQEHVSPRVRRKRLKAERLKLKRMVKQQKREERLKRKQTREMLRQQALKAEYEEKMKKLQEKYKLSSEEPQEQEGVQVAVTKEEPESKRDMLNQTLKEAFPEKKSGKDDEKLIEEVLKEYLFR